MVDELSIIGSMYLHFLLSLVELIARQFVEKLIDNCHFALFLISYGIINNDDYISLSFTCFLFLKNLFLINVIYIIGN